MIIFSKDDSKSSAGLDSEDRVQSPAEVISQLESLLGATSEKLEQQRRLNHALIKRKVLYYCDSSCYYDVPVFNEITGAGFQGQCGYLKKRANSAKLKFYRLD